jgi:hypothetical protein
MIRNGLNFEAVKCIFKTKWKEKEEATKHKLNTWWVNFKNLVLFVKYIVKETHIIFFFKKSWVLNISFLTKNKLI